MSRCVCLDTPCLDDAADGRVSIQLVIYKASETKRYDFEARSADEAAEIVAELTKGFSPYRDGYHG